MKKFLSLALVFVLVLVTLTSCDFLNNLLNKEEETTPPAPTYDIDAAAAFFDNLYKEDYSPKRNEETGETEFPVVQADLTVVAQIVIEGLTYTVEWAVDSDKVTVGEAKDGKIIIDIDEESDAEVKFVLTATIKDGNGKTATRSYTLIVPEYILWSHEEYMNAKKDDAVVIQGIVVAMNSTSAGNKRNHLFLADTKVEGGYYSYQMTVDPAELGIEVGMLVEVSGPASPYTAAGSSITMPEIYGGSARIVDANKQNVAPIDVTAKFAAGESLVQYVGRTVTIKGVEIGTQELGGSSDYLWFKLGDKSAYLRTYLTDMPHNLLSKDENGTPISAAKTTIEAAHLAHFSYSADVTGVVIYYGAQVYLMPLDTNCFVYGEKIELTPEQKIEAALGQVEIPTLIAKDTTLELPAASKLVPEVKFTWTVSEGYTITDNKIELKVPNNAVTIKFTVVATCEGKTSEPKTFSVQLGLTTAGIYEEASKLANNAKLDGTFTMTGVITSVDTPYSADHKNVTVTILVDGYKFQCYRLAGEGADVIKVGDTLTVTGEISAYNKKVQFAQGTTIVSYKAPAATKDLYDAAAQLANNVKLDGTYLMTGVITVVDTPYSAEHKNVTVTIEVDGYKFQCYRLAGEGADVIAVGDTITVVGKISAYKGTVQFAQGTVIDSYEKAPTEGAISIKIEDIADALNWENGTQYLSFEMDEGITVSATGGSNTGKYYTSGENWRIYQTENPTVTIKAAEGKTIVSVKITYTSNNSGVLTQGTTQITSDTVVTVNANSVSFSVGNTSADVTNGQARITAIEVVLA